MIWSEAQIDRYLRSHLRHWLDPSLSGREKEIAERVVTNLRAGLIRLNRLPRTDPFWTNTNREPTLYKLGDYLTRVLRENPLDREARWGLIASDWANGSNACGATWLEPLIEEDPHNVYWLVTGTRLLRESSGADGEEVLRASLARLRARNPQFGASLRGLLADPDPRVAEAAQYALQFWPQGRA